MVTMVQKGGAHRTFLDAMKVMRAIIGNRNTCELSSLNLHQLSSQEIRTLICKILSDDNMSYIHRVENVIIFSHSIF
jgi:hypothetical protein